MSLTPLVTINILSFNRKDELYNTLTKVFEQDYKNIEVIVVDNTSSDGSPEMVEQEFPDVILIQMQKNIGIAGWNEGFKIAKGEYVLVLDDDSYPLEHTISNGLKGFYNKDIAIVALRVFNNYLNRDETEYFEKYPLSFIGCGALIRREILEIVGVYDALIFLYHNELDLSIRAQSNGYKILYCSNSLIIHVFSTQARKGNAKNILMNKSRYENFFQSYALVFIKNFSGITLLWLLFKLFVNRTMIAFVFFYWDGYIRALSKLILILPQLIAKRVPVDKNIQTKYKNVIKFIDRDFFRTPINLIKHFTNS